MGYNLYANNETLKNFHLGAFSWSHLLEQCGAYFLCMFKGGRWYMVDDERVTTHHHSEEDGEREQKESEFYPALICTCGFEITEEEAKVLARIARNYATIQRTLKEPPDGDLIAPITTPDYLKSFPTFIRRDWVELFEQFADWAEQSHGFKVY